MPLLLQVELLFRSVFQKQPSHETKTKTYHTLLQVEHAAAQGNLDLVTALLSAGGTGTPGLRGCRGRTLLDAAAEGGNEKVVSALLKAGSRPDLRVRSGSKKRYVQVNMHGSSFRCRKSTCGGVGLMKITRFVGYDPFTCLCPVPQHKQQECLTPRRP